MPRGSERMAALVFQPSQPGGEVLHVDPGGGSEGSHGDLGNDLGLGHPKTCVDNKGQ